jgi:hypothetical protein
MRTIVNEFMTEQGKAHFYRIIYLDKLWQQASVKSTPLLEIECILNIIL